MSLSNKIIENINANIKKITAIAFFCCIIK